MSHAARLSFKNHEANAQPRSAKENRDWSAASIGEIGFVGAFEAEWGRIGLPRAATPLIIGVMINAIRSLRRLGAGFGFVAGLGLLASAGCTQETQNRISRSIQNWTGTNGVLEVYDGGKVVKRFLEIDKLSTAYGTDDRVSRPYRFGYGVLDENLNGQTDEGENKVYFEISDYATPYVFHASPR